MLQIVVLEKSDIDPASSTENSLSLSDEHSKTQFTSPYNFSILVLMRLCATNKRLCHHQQTSDWETVVEPSTIKYSWSTSAI